MPDAIMARRNNKDRIADEELKQRRAPQSQEFTPDDVSEASAESFPASDAPSWTGLRLGPPDRRDTGSAP
jgi:hypothetical protein